MRPGLAIFWALVLAVVIAAVVGYALLTLVCKDSEASAPASSGAPQSEDAVSAPAAAPAPVAAPSAGAAMAAEPEQAGADETDAEAEVEAEAAETPAADAPANTGAVTPAEPAADPVPASAEPAAPVAAEGEGVKPKGLDAPRDSGADDLKRIKGVGPKLEVMLNEMGYYHFDQIAAWSADEVAWVDQNLKGFKGRVSRDSWVDQASKLATGEETEFSKRVDKGDVY
ncbi:endonuclease [Pseudooceanicola atlanticus]|nr:endonuclease [Pseudooceanicola atlanticus]